MAPASFGQTVSLGGESLESTPATGQQTTFGSFTCDKNGTTVVPFQTSGSAFGPYSGTFTETGTITIGPQTVPGLDATSSGPILDFQASFTITSVFPTATITGTKHLAPTSPPAAELSAFGHCDPDGSSPPAGAVFAIVSDPFVLYDAQINAVTGTRTDSGTSGFVIQSVTSPTAPASFQEAFNSTSPPECEDGNNGNGNGNGHPKKKHDNDDEEDCD
ncbi:MAG TPA: hypothetical protein VK486_09500 [Thermoleophilaceae bacterium]|nr:hypothetical protein [Thermoleophilaceae bacterium]